jgi:hypothetical protein
MISGLALSLCAGTVAMAQCAPEWDIASGNPGIAGGYAAPVRGWNDGSGEKLFVGGSFTSAGGSGANQYLARWDRTTNTWSSVGSGISGGFTNAFMTSMVPFNPGTGERLVVGGFYDTAGGVPNTASLAMWNGTSWEAMGTGWTGTTRGSIWSMAPWNGRLYVGGGIVNQPAMLAGQPWAGMASWDGATWVPTITSITGNNVGIMAMAVFNDGSGEKLYVAGRFSSINGVTGTSLVARWDGTNWSTVGGGLTSTNVNFGLEAMTVFNDGTGPALYVAGYSVFRTGLPTCNVAKWNGTAWAPVGAQIGTGRITSIAAFDDGAGSKLYIGGTAMPQIFYIARWENNAWTPVGGGIPVPGAAPFPSVFGLGAWGGKLYVAGNFTQIGPGPLTASGPCRVDLLPGHRLLRELRRIDHRADPERQRLHMLPEPLCGRREFRQLRCVHDCPYPERERLHLLPEPVCGGLPLAIRAEAAVRVSDGGGVAV